MARNQLFAVIIFAGALLGVQSCAPHQVASRPANTAMSIDTAWDSWRDLQSLRSMARDMGAVLALDSRTPAQWFLARRVVLHNFIKDDPKGLKVKLPENSPGWWYYRSNNQVENRKWSDIQARELIFQAWTTARNSPVLGVRKDGTTEIYDHPYAPREGDVERWEKFEKERRKT